MKKTPIEDVNLENFDTIAKRLSFVRKQLELNRDELAEIVGFHRNSIARYETGQGKPTNEFIHSLCSKFDIEEAWFVSGVKKAPIRDEKLNKESRQGVAKRLKKLAGKQTSIAFGLKCKVDPLAMIGFIRGWFTPNAENLNRISGACDVSIDWLINGTNPETKNIDHLVNKGVVVTLEHVLRELNRTISPEKKGDIINTLYDIYANTGNDIDPSVVKKILLLTTDEA